MANNTILKNKRKGECFGCGRSNEKSRFKRKTISGSSVYVCPGCGTYNSESIFKEMKDAPKQKLIFGQPIK